MTNRLEQQSSTVMNKVFRVMKFHAVVFGLEHHVAWYVVNSVSEDHTDTISLHESVA
jgi:hypothetical protein